MINEIIILYQRRLAMKSKLYCCKVSQGEQTLTLLFSKKAERNNIAKEFLEVNKLFPTLNLCIAAFEIISKPLESMAFA